MACCLTAPSHYLNQCWLIITKVLWHSFDDFFSTDASAISRWKWFWNWLTKILFGSPMGQWVPFKQVYISKAEYNRGPGGKGTASLQWRHNAHDGVSNHQPHDCLPNRLFRHRSKKTSKLCVTGLCVRNSPVTDEFPAQEASNTKSVSIWWRHHNAIKYNLQNIYLTGLYQTGGNWDVDKKLPARFNVDVLIHPCPNFNDGLTK